MVEQLGFGIPRILQVYNKDIFRFSDNFLRIVLPGLESSAPQVTPQVEELLKVFTGIHSRSELQERLELTDRKNFRINYLNPSIEIGLVSLTIPDKPTSHKQEYYLTEKRKEFNQ